MSDKGQHRTCQRFWCGKYLCKVTWCIQLLRTYHVHKTTWPWASLKVHKCHMKVNVKLIQYFDVDNITINLHDKAIYCVHRVPDAARHLSACLPRQRQYPSSLRGLRGKKVSCFQTSRAFFEAFLHVWSTRRWRTNTNCNEGPQTVGHVWWGWAKKILMRHIYGTFQKSSLGVEDFSGAPILPFIGLPDFANPPDVAKI